MEKWSDKGRVVRFLIRQSDEGEENTHVWLWVEVDRVRVMGVVGGSSEESSWGFRSVMKALLSSASVIVKLAYAVLK